LSLFHQRSTDHTIYLELFDTVLFFCSHCLIRNIITCTGCNGTCHQRCRFGYCMGGR